MDRLRENGPKIFLRCNPKDHRVKHRPNNDKYWFNIYPFSGTNNTNKHNNKDGNLNKYMWVPKYKHWQYEDTLWNTNIFEHIQHESKWYYGRKCFFQECTTQVFTYITVTQDDNGSYASEDRNNLGSNNWEDLNGKWYFFCHYYSNKGQIDSDWLSHLVVEINRHKHWNSVVDSILIQESTYQCGFDVLHAENNLSSSLGIGNCDRDTRCWSCCDF